VHINDTGIMAIVKSCSKHGPLTETDIRIDTWKNKVYRRCKKCIYEKNLKYFSKQATNEEYMKKKRERDALYWIKNKDEIMKKRVARDDNGKRRESYKINAEKYREIYKIKQQTYRDNLSDSYIRKIIQNGNKDIKFKDIPQALIECKRSCILLKKALKKITVLEKNTGDMKDANKKT